MAAPKTVLTYPLNGSNKDFTIPFEYLARKFVVVTLIGITRRTLVLNSEYRFSTKTGITTTSAWGAAQGFDSIELRRVTSATDRLVDFSDGSILRAYDLNTSQIQSLHIAEEARDLTADTIGVNNNGDLDARGRKIVNAADGVDDGDVVNMRQQKAWAGSALNQAQAAAGFAGQAAGQAAASLASANASSSSATNSAGYRDTALTYRNAAEGFKNQAETFKNNASDSAATAQNWGNVSQRWSSDSEDTVVSNGLYSSYHYSMKSSKSAAASAASASGAAASATTATQQADRAKTEADKLGNMNSLGGALESVAGTTVIWKGDQQSRASFVARNDVEANFSFTKNDGSDRIRLVRTADRTVQIYDDAKGSRVSFGENDVTFPKPLTVQSTMTIAGLATFNNIIQGNNEVKALTSFSVRASGTGNSHLWFHDANGATRGVIYGNNANEVVIQAGSALALRCTPAGDTFVNKFTSSGLTSNGMGWFIRPGSPWSQGMYGDCAIQVQANDGGLPAIGFHSAGRVANAIYLSTNDNQFWNMNNAGENRLFLTNANLMSQFAANMSSGLVGCTALLQNVSGANQGENALLGGGSLWFSSHNAVNQGYHPTGTWRCMGYCNNGGVSLWIRVS